MPLVRALRVAPDEASFRSKDLEDCRKQSKNVGSSSELGLTMETCWLTLAGVHQSGTMQARATESPVILRRMSHGLTSTLAKAAA